MTTNLSDVMYLPTYKKKIPGTDIEIRGKNQIVNLSENERPILLHAYLTKVVKFMKIDSETPYDEIYEIIPLDLEKFADPDVPEIKPELSTTTHFLILKKVTNLYDLPADIVHALPYSMRLDILKTVIDKGFDWSCLYVLQDDPDVRKALLHIRNRNTLPLVVLQILSHDNNPDIEIEALDLRSENNLSPCFYPWSES